jgi:aspartyl-tRNA(Asn)/glutamyl-tRNA(Gln) amidotransferase subunit C
MEVKNELIERLAHLARLRFADDEMQHIQNDLQRMISFVERLQQIDTTGVEPLLHMSDTVNVLREDEIKKSITHDEALRNAPQKDEKFFLVPKVIKK